MKHRSITKSCKSIVLAALPFALISCAPHHPVPTPALFQAEQPTYRDSGQKSMGVGLHGSQYLSNLLGSAMLYTEQQLSFHLDTRDSAQWLIGGGASQQELFSAIWDSDSTHSKTAQHFQGGYGILGYGRQQHVTFSPPTWLSFVPEFNYQQQWNVNFAYAYYPDLMHCPGLSASYLAQFHNKWFNPGYRIALAYSHPFLQKSYQTFTTKADLELDTHYYPMLMTPRPNLFIGNSLLLSSPLGNPKKGLQISAGLDAGQFWILQKDYQPLAADSAKFPHSDSKIDFYQGFRIGLSYLF